MSDMNTAANLAMALSTLGKSMVIEYPNSGAWQFSSEAQDMARATLADEARKEEEKKQKKEAKKQRLAGIAGQAASMIPVVGPVAGPAVTEALGGDSSMNAMSGMDMLGALSGMKGDKGAKGVVNTDAIEEAAQDLGTTTNTTLNDPLAAANAVKATSAPAPVDISAMQTGGQLSTGNTPLASGQFPISDPIAEQKERLKKLQQQNQDTQLALKGLTNGQ